MALNLDDLIGSLQSVHAGDRGQGIEEIRENLRMTLGQAAMGPPRLDGFPISSSSSGTKAIRMNGAYGRYSAAGPSCSGNSPSGNGLNGSSKKRRILKTNGYPQPHHHHHPHHHANLQMRQRPHYSSPSHSRSRDRSKGWIADADEGAQQHMDGAATGEDDDSMGDSTMTGGEDIGPSYFFGASQRIPCDRGGSSMADLNVPYPSPVSGFTATATHTQPQQQHLPPATSSGVDLPASPATSSYPRSFTSTTSSSGAGPSSSFTSTSASSHSGTGSSGFYNVGAGAAPPANTPQQTPSDRDDTLAIHRNTIVEYHTGARRWGASGQDEEIDMAAGGHGEDYDAGVLINDADEATAGVVPRGLTSAPRQPDMRGSDALDFSRAASSSPKKLVSGFTPTIQS